MASNNDFYSSEILLNGVISVDVVIYHNKDSKFNPRLLLISRDELGKDTANNINIIL